MNNLQRWAMPDGYDVGRLQADISRDSRNPTWTNYQKLVSGIMGSDLGRGDYHFLDHCFMTDLSQTHLPNSNWHRQLPDKDRRRVDALRSESIAKKSELLKMPFFRNFSIVVMACGHYPIKHKFNIENVFNVGWTKETTVLSTGNFYNEHYGPGKTLIHTRQMSSGVSDTLIHKIAALCRPFYEDTAK